VVPLVLVKLDPEGRTAKFGVHVYSTRSTFVSIAEPRAYGNPLFSREGYIGTVINYFFAGETVIGSTQEIIYVHFGDEWGGWSNIVL